jgi:hypothetical protein
MVKGKNGENQSYFMKNEHKKTPENLDFPGFLSLFGCKIASDQRLEN